ncbi:MAG: hypothetical protein N2109_05170 [Fimbriimonadales bacterium]|nr:hypothetical protein [Fimbriimonadales bacterium]
MVVRLTSALLLGFSVLLGCGPHPDQEGTPMKPASLDESMKQKGFSAEEQQSIGARGH